MPAKTEGFSGPDGLLASNRKNTVFAEKSTSSLQQANSFAGL